MGFDLGRGAWPDAGLTLDRFVRRIEELGVTREDLAVRAPEIFLALACADGDPAALRAFESRYLEAVGGYVQRFDLPAHLVDEVRQRVRQKLLMGDPPGIGGYRGRGPLGAWVRVAAVRVAIDVAAAEAGSEGGREPDVALLELSLSQDASPESAAARRLYGERFRAALEASLVALTARDKTLLRLHVVDGLNIEAIGSIYRVHRATVARWLVAIRGRIYENVRRQLGLVWRSSSSELRSLIELLRTEVHVSVKRLLET